ncbi:toll-like receptor 7 [Salarias fasciatus]|uniref:Toll-like receptor 7 n=1 Tax=Salarias fasciatus TaxID=181472 RepID=A0A672JU21_SALFA|nr:toll-like receptor 7 [Salarias fasciatus]
MAAIFWTHLGLIWLCCLSEAQLAPGKPKWMSPQFPCDVSATNTSQVRFLCRRRHLTRVPDGVTSNATELVLSDNSIESIPADAFSELLNLTVLNLNRANNNKRLNIHGQAFKNLTKLKQLGMAGTHQNKTPEDLPFSLEILELDNNNITVLDNKSLVGLENVTQLLLSRNCYMWNPCGKYFIIHDNSFAVMTKLQILDLSYNNITEVPKGLPRTLTKLLLGSNKIQHIGKDDFSMLHNLKELKIQGNCPRCQNAPYPCETCKNISLDIHPDAFQSLTQLKELNLGGNSLKYINPSWFEKLNNLKDLFLSFNFLMGVITGEATFLKYLPKLERIDVSFNYALQRYPETISLSKEFSHLVSLKTLHMEALVFKNIGPNTLRPLYQLKNLSALNMGTNFIINTNSTVFKQFQHLKLIYLSENRLYPTPGDSSPKLSNGYNDRLGFSISPNLNSHRKDFVYEINHGLIKDECFHSGRVLALGSNNLFFISSEQFESYGNISCLNLSRNGFSAALNGTEFKSLPNLKYLDLSFNKIDLAYDNAFKELQKLEVLDISYNSHYFKAFGITQTLNFTKNLPVLRVLNMSYNSIFTLTTKQMHSQSLSELQFTNNYLGTLWKENDKTYEKLFTNLTNLTTLDISHNHILKIPYNVYHNLPRNLTVLRINHNSLRDFIWDKLKHFPLLEILDLSYNSLTNITGISSNISKTLTYLDLSNNYIFSLVDEFSNCPKSLKTLSLSFNKLTLINQSAFQRGPDNPENPIKTLFLWKNPFQCTCDSMDFILWIERGYIKLPRLTTEVTCDTPANQKGQALINFDINQCVNDSVACLMYIFTTFLTVAFMLVATVAHLFYWDAFYFLHYVKAKLKGYRTLKSQDSIYDLFVTYDTRDPQVSEWVMKNLRVKLEEEGEKHHPLCLEERDWTPGVPLVDNLTQSIQYSRKTLFVLTEGYVKTGSFRLAMYLAHQRLLDENVDVIVLLMLEPVLQHSRFLRLRRRLCGKSVVEWPKTAAAEPWFWQNLRNVVQVDNQVMYNKTYSKYFANK